MPKKTKLPPIKGSLDVTLEPVTLKAQAQVTLSDVLLDLSRRSQAATVLLLVTQLDDALERRIKDHLPQLNSAMKDKLFSGNGPFATFSAKIDTAYALACMNNTSHHDFHIIRRIRNKFAHPRGLVHFESEEILDLIEKFKGYKKNDPIDRFVFFTNKIDAAWDAINPKLTLASYLQHHYVPAVYNASRDKS